jgi:hypothetical protein
MIVQHQLDYDFKYVGWGEKVKCDRFPSTFSNIFIVLVAIVLKADNFYMTCELGTKLKAQS